jgi:beta-lactamase class A
LYHLHIDTKKHKIIRQSGFRFTSPLLDVEYPEGVQTNNEPIPFKKKVLDYIKLVVENGRVKNVSLYFRDLNDGPWFGIDADHEYNAASMMKVPVMIAWLKKAEKDPKILKRIYTYDGKDDMSAGQGIRPSETLSPGVGYTVEELLHYMLNYSDNNATKILYENLRTAEINDVLDSIGVANNLRDGGNYISPIEYSSFFRILYNAVYLEREMSEKALQFLILQDFPNGIAAGVPQGVPVAAKFGEQSSGLQPGEKQLHEFGIIYHPNGPYILGIMTQGDGLEQQAEVIRSLSALVYAGVSNSVFSGGHRSVKNSPINN